MPKRFDPQQDLTPIRGQTIRDLQRAGESGLDFRAAAPMSSQNFGGGRFFRQGTVSALKYIQLTGPAGPDGGYPWVQVTQAPPIKVTAPGSGYASPPTATVSGNGWTGWTLTVTVNTTTGTVTGGTWTGAAGASGTANLPPTISLSGGGGSGGTLAISDAQDVLTPAQWVVTTLTGDYSNAAYEGRGCFGIPNDGIVYPAVTGPNGKLLFFCNPVLVGTTTHVTTYPTTPRVFYAIQPLTVYGDQVEGTAGTFDDGPAGGGTYPLLFALNLGTVVPVENTPVVCRWSGTRWVFAYYPNVGSLQVTTHESPSTTLNVDVSAGYWADSTDATLTHYAGTTSFALTASATNSLYLDSGGTLTKGTSGYPGSGHFTKLATAVTNGSKVTGLTDDRTFLVAVQET